MAQTQNISDFYTAVQSRDFARQFQFRIGAWDVGGESLLPDQLIYLETATLPGRAITNVPVPFMGLQFNVPGTATYPGSDSWSVTFRCDSDYEIRSSLEQVLENTFSVDDSSGNYNIAGPASKITLNLLDKGNNTIKQYNLVGVYVVSLGDVSYNLGDNGTIQTVPATLAYQYWTNSIIGPTN
jgi:hypothetical protein